MYKFFIGFFMAVLTSGGLNAKTSTSLITHAETKAETLDLATLKQRLANKQNTTLSTDENIALLEQLSQFELGRFLLLNKGLNGYWTAYLILHAPKKEGLTPLEHWLVHKAPSVRATQERFKIFQTELQARLRNNQTIASIPCGTMDDLLTLNYADYSGLQFTGIDLDAESLALAHKNAEARGMKHATFSLKNAWNLSYDKTFDMITSNGLNIYEPDDAKVTELYKQFYAALKPGGILITSFLTPPPALSSESTWKNVDLDAAKKQKALFTEVIGVGWQAFRTEAVTRAQLIAAGFEVLKVVYDSQGIFPTVVARKKP